MSSPSRKWSNARSNCVYQNRRYPRVHYQLRPSGLLKVHRPLIRQRKPKEQVVRPRQLSLPTTPDQPTHPSDPNWSGGTEESKDEENTKAMLHEVLTDTMNFLESDFTRIHWQRSGHRVELFHSYLHSELHYSCLENETRWNSSWELNRWRRSMTGDLDYDGTVKKDQSIGNIVELGLSSH